MCSPEDKKQILDILINDAQISVQHDTMSTCKTEPLSFDNLVSYHDSFIDNHEFLNDLQMELDSMDLYRPQSKKPSSFWISD